MSEESVVFLVMGSSGEYEDWRTWPVRAFPTEAEAEAHRTALDAAVQVYAVRQGELDEAYFQETQTIDGEQWERRRHRAGNVVRALDPRFSDGDSDTRYTLQTVPFGVAP